MEDLEEIFRNYKPDDDDFFDELEELLIMADMGVDTVDRVVTSMHYLCFDKNIKRGDKAREVLIDELKKELNAGDSELKLNTTPSVILMVGVNGVGKTTTCSARATPSAPQRPSSCRSGRTAPGSTLSATRRGAIPPPSYLTASAPAGREGTMSSSSTPPAACTTRPIS